MRNTYKYPKLPFIAGDFVREWRIENFPQDKEIPAVQAIRDVCKNIGCAAFVETSELHSNHQDTGNGDTVHFSREALNIMGVKYFNAFLGI